ncbi:sterile alpha motif domain-containing protein 13 isoform X2 [Lathamus discolor]|uniref:sterile alpha motif domain-containing protein 13 isoform X2 n=1 Tax=Lathamus discolor TaxID=678569 RepID=UPI0032B740F5
MLTVDMENKENGSLDVKNSVENGRPPDPADWAVTDVVNYFRTAGFEEQANAFQEQGIGLLGLQLTCPIEKRLTSLDCRFSTFPESMASHVEEEGKGVNVFFLFLEFLQCQEVSMSMLK